MDKSPDSYDRQIENALKKKELTEKYGASFSEGNNELPPDIESEWLKNIEQFEQQYESAETIRLYNYVGQPEYKKLGEVRESDLQVELKRLYTILMDNGIMLDALAEVSDFELYRFITEELFEYEMDNIRVAGMTTNFIYEEFHPNARLDIQRAFEYFFDFTLAKSRDMSGESYDMLYIDIERYTDARGNHLPQDAFLQRMHEFLEAFDHFKVLHNTIDEIIVNGEKTVGEVHFTIAYQGCFADDTSLVTYSGKGLFKLHPSKYDGWEIYHINMPGLTI